MISRCSEQFSAARQAGAALAAALVLAGAAAALASAAMLDATVQAAMTRQFTNRSRARLSTYSALQMARSTLQSATADYTYRFNSPHSMNAIVSVRYLGETISTSAAGSASALRRYRHYELIAEVTEETTPAHRRVLRVRLPVEATL